MLNSVWIEEEAVKIGTEIETTNKKRGRAKQSDQRGNNIIEIERDLPMSLFHSLCPRMGQIPHTPIFLHMACFIWLISK